MKFFFDRNISKYITRMLDAYDTKHTVIHQDDDARFVATDDDVHLITTVASESPKPVWVTADISQGRVAEERSALASSGMHVVFFKRFHKDPHTQAMKALACWPAICDRCANARPPTGFEVPAAPLKGGKVDRV
ncbi:MAG: hypothetical protein AAF842_10990, partial [Planctomycetota bacterium]